MRSVVIAAASGLLVALLAHQVGTLVIVLSLFAVLAGLLMTMTAIGAVVGIPLMFLGALGAALGAASGGTGAAVLMGLVAGLTVYAVTRRRERRAAR
jgi:hypothetical protein